MITKLSIIIPVYNEESTIQEVFERVVNVALVNNISKEIIVINDRSSDNSLQKIEEVVARFPEVEAVVETHAINQGKGAAIHTGLRLATGDYVIMQDADLELNPEEYNRLLQPILDGEANVVYGSRFLNKQNDNSTALQKMANKFLTGLSNVVFGIKITDMETCYKLIPTETIKNIRLKEQRFGFEPEITAKLAKLKDTKFKEVPITFKARQHEQGKKIGWTDGVRAMYCIIKYGWFSK